MGNLGDESFQSPTKSLKRHGRFIKRAFKVHNMLKWIYEGSGDNQGNRQGIWTILPTIMILAYLRKAWKEDFKATNMLKRLYLISWSCLQFDYICKTRKWFLSLSH